MAAKVYVSPSTQEGNAYAGGGNEEDYMRRICARACQYLVAAGHQAKMGGTVSPGANAEQSNAWGAQWYVAVHSNAGGGHGTEAWHYTGSALGKKLAEAVYRRVAAASNEADRGVKSNTTFIELRKPKAPACLVEVAFHDCPKEAAEIRAGVEEFGRAVAQGVLDVVGGAIPSTGGGTTPPPPKPTAGWRISSQGPDIIVLRKGAN